MNNLNVWRNVKTLEHDARMPIPVKTSRPKSVATKLECSDASLLTQLSQRWETAQCPKPDKSGGIPVQVQILPRSKLWRCNVDESLEPVAPVVAQIAGLSKLKICSDSPVQSWPSPTILMEVARYAKKNCPDLRIASNGYGQTSIIQLWPKH